VFAARSGLTQGVIGSPLSSGGSHANEESSLGRSAAWEVDAEPLLPGATLRLSIVPGRTFEVPLTLMADAGVTVTTASPVDENDAGGQCWWPLRLYSCRRRTVAMIGTWSE